MIGFAQTQKSVILVAPIEGTTNGVSGAVDTLGWDYLSVDFILDTAAATANVVDTCKLGESQDATNYTDIVAFTGGTATSTSVGFVLPTAADTSDPETYRMNVDLRGRERYIKASLTLAQATSQVCINGRLGQHNTAGDNTDATLLGASKVVTG